MRHKKIANQGFSLIELMVVVLILGIIAAIAIPNYTRWVTQSRRTDAQTALLNVANRLEKYFSYCNTYTTVTAGVWPANCPPEPGGAGLGLGNPLLSPDRHYVITIQGGTLNGAAVASTNYIINAVPASALVGTGQQVNDAECTQFRLDSTGARAAVGTASARCWKK